MDSSVIIPIYNEEENISLLWEKTFGAFQDLNVQYEIIFINDGSTDRSLEILLKLKQQYPNIIKIITLSKNAGQSAALVAGFNNARGHTLITLDSDLQNDPSDIPLLLKEMDHNDVVCGIRKKRQDSWVRKISSRIANKTRNRFTNEDIKDVGCSLRAFKKDLLKNIHYFNGFHRFFPTLLKLYNSNPAPLKIKEIYVNHHPRKFGKSKYNIRNRLFKSLHDLVGVRWLQQKQISYDIKEIK
ncbi:MAG: glycosyltransferase family 2 protein [Deltaproteobacteria bacterium]|nr:glycosyltransferase family 2 protein [Deltaproteobacteria bacterium]